jgi:prophage tail gpP-like protein
MAQSVQRSFSEHTSGRHAFSYCFGKGGEHAKAVHVMERMDNDYELYRFGFTDEIVQYDEEAKTPLDAEYLAKRKMGEDRRDNWILRYTVSGHTTPSLSGDRMLIWTPNTTVTVLDEELGDFLGNNSQFSTGQDCYLESLEFTRYPATTTALRIMRKQDLYYLGESSEFETEETKHVAGHDSSNPYH